jgi:molybdopterin-guanine dinucleotide biosynthesis protein A
VVILAGGRGTRLGGVDKPGLIVGSATMAAAVTSAAAAAGARRVVLVGPARADLAKIADSLPDGLIVAGEDPPGAGPVPALRAGLAWVLAPWVAVLAADLPFLRGGQVRGLLAIASGTARAGVIMADDSGAAQWLAGCWRTARLRSALLEYRGSSLRGLLAPLDPMLVSYATPPGEPPPWLDCDTPGELAAARAWQQAPLAGPAMLADRPASPAGTARDSGPRDSGKAHPRGEAKQ